MNDARAISSLIKELWHLKQPPTRPGQRSATLIGPGWTLKSNCWMSWPASISISQRETCRRWLACPQSQAEFTICSTLSPTVDPTILGWPTTVAGDCSRSPLWIDPTLPLWCWRSNPKVEAWRFCSSDSCLTVAHRVKIILDSDYILVMSDGQAAEFDTPQKLIDRGKLFRGLAKVTITISKLMAFQGMLLYWICTHALPAILW